MSDSIFTPERLNDYSVELFNKLGFKKEESEIISDILIEADLRGINSHGVARIPIYAQRIMSGSINVDSHMNLINENETSALLDADNGMGHLASYNAMKVCIKKAKEYGMSSVAVRSSNHFGISAYYTMMAAEENLIGMAFTNTSPLMAPFGGKERLLGSNPLSIAIPAGEEPTMVIDMATSLAARGKLEVAARKGLSIPEGWAIDSEGKATTDPIKGLAGALLPFGGPKGYGLAVFVDIVSGVLTGSSFGVNCGSLFEDINKPQNIGHFFMAINVENFMPINAFNERMDDMIKSIRNSEKAEGVSRIYMPGEIEYEKSIETRKNGIAVNEKVVKELNELAKNFGVPAL